MGFDYILKKIELARFSDVPFRQLSVEDLFTPQDFVRIVTSQKVDLPKSSSDRELMSRLADVGFDPIQFPGTTTDLEQYIEWHGAPRSVKHVNQDTCEGMGVAFRLKRFEGDEVLARLNDFFTSQEFIAAVARKFEISLEHAYADMGLQKYLDGYEISPHPDIRRKALTFMININPSPISERLDYHTHYMAFERRYAFVQRHWENEADVDRCWVPWSWCRTVRRQTRNNSLVMFRPDNNTMHAVRARYDHLQTQRTQFYGNLWFNNFEPSIKTTWRDYETGQFSHLKPRDGVVQSAGRMLASSYKRLLRM